ncbi:MAG: universal stress protein [Bradyrhizobiaceae bacterium]|nr:universal stress protein [Bradyrhizobiaceae bacterium]
MSFATLMVHVEFEPKADARVRLAAGLADRHASALIGISASVLPPYPSENGYFVTGAFLEQERRDILAALARAEAAFRAAAGRCGGPAGAALEWRSAVELPENYVVAQARSADLVIVGKAQGEVDIARALDPGTAILKAGRPVLVVPPGVDTLKAERVLVAWKDGREARRAVKDALPLLRGALSVAIVEVCEVGSEAEGRQHAEDVARYLARHRISVGKVMTAAATASVADHLIEAATAHGADLLVAGGYGHSRLGEWIFGGVTRDLLRSSPVCCLFAH